MSRSLLLKGLAGVAALGGTVGGLVVFRKEIFGGGKAEEEPKSEDVSNFSQKDLIDKVGLNCQFGESETELTDGTTKECSVKEGSTLRIMVGQQEEEGVTFTTNGSKLKVSKSDEKGTDGTDKYTKKLKFVVDSGDITLTKGGSNATTIPKLEQFETYEVFLRDKKFYLRRKTDAKEEKIKALGLPSGKGKCSLPETGDSNCTLTIEEAKKINFENQTGGVTVSTGEVRLKISKMSDSTDFTDGYRFTFTFPSEVTINSKQLKGNIPYDFKIKKAQGSNTLTLEKAWESDDAFTKKAGLKCETNKECSVSTEAQKLNVKVGTQKKTDISTIDTSTGKIKMETEQAGYNQGLKFTITSGDVTISNGTGEGISKLEELETYEITEEGGKYYLTRKTSKDESIRSSLVLPKGCELPTNNSVECDLSTDDFKKINFKDKSSPASTGTVKLKISKANSTDFPLGYKFTFNTTTEATIKNSEIKIKANIPTDFKIKKEDGSSTLTLERAWSEFSFAEKVGLTCTGSDGCCTKSTGGSEKLNVKRGEVKKEGITGINGSGSGKIKVEKDQAGYNQGLKFTITTADVTLTGGNVTSGSGTIDKLEELETYEITEEGDKYYLTRKTGASETIENQLGLPSNCKLSSNSCSLNTEQIKKINFEGKDTNGVSMSSGTATLTIAKQDKKDDFPLGYKFTLQSTQDITIKSTTNVVKQNISTDFKIKKPTSTGSLSLEKAWTAESLGKKVGLSCSNGTECTIDSTSGSNLRVKQMDAHDNDVEQTTLSKSTSGSGCSTSGKIKVEKDQAGYNQGFKFKIEDGNIKLNGSTGSDDSSNVHRLGEFETYEIKEEGSKGWFLVRKDRTDDFIKKQLKLEGVGCSESEKFPHGPTGGTTCKITDANKLKNINFEGKDKHNNNWPSGTIDVSLEIKHDSSLPGGFKFVFTNNGSSDVCLPTGTSGGKFNLQKSSSSGVDYKIKKTGSGDSTTLTLEKHNGGSNNCSS